jgi:hypothetical protein
MPIEYRIDHERRLVLARGRGILGGDDIFAYQREVWSRADVAGYNELMDMSDVEQVVSPTPGRIRDLATLSASMDAPASESKFAIVAPKDLEFGLGRMYEAYRALNERSKKQVGVFRSLAEALAYLGVENQDALSDP